ncbi:MAG: flagellar assembly protein H, partial [Jaaginema sp. PMC 1078.18]|nr:flagellar assembly protein H [Jaaginema sp. PMC 1078.18]
MTESERIDHDRLFKELIQAFPEDFLLQFLPDVATRLVFPSLTFEGTELFTDVTSGQKYTADLVALAQLDNPDTPFVLHIEHQSGSKSNFPRRMWLYFSRLHEKYNLPVCQVAVLAFDEPQRADPNNYTVDFLGYSVLNLQYRTIQLNRLHWQDFVERDSPIICAFMAKMRMQTSERPRVKLQCLLMLVRLPLDAARSQLLSGFIDTYLRLNASEE